MLAERAAQVEKTDAQPDTFLSQTAHWSSSLLAPYRRVTSSGQFIPEIDGLRFVAILSVFIYHLSGDVLRHSPTTYVDSIRANLFFRLTQELNIGVPLFFVISGFILGMPFASWYLGSARKVSLKKYFLRRVTRLEPPYMISLIVFFLLKYAKNPGTLPELIPHFAASLAYIHNVIFGTPSMINFVAWSLEIEIQFYLLAPLLATVFAVRPKISRRSLIVVACVLAAGLQLTLPSTVRLSVIGYLQYFLAGFLLADFHITGDMASVGRAKWDWIAWSGWLVLGFLLLQYPALIPFATPFLLVFVYYAALHGSWFRRFCSNVWIATIGGMCYTIYLIHNYIIAFLGQYSERFSTTGPFPLRVSIQFLIMAPAVMLVSAFYYRVIERPCMIPDWPQRLLLSLRLKVGLAKRSVAG